MSASEVYSPEDDEAAFAQVYRAHHAKLLRYCQYRLRDRHEAEDVAQEAFARAWRSMPTSAYDVNFYPWLRVVASNLCTDVLRKRSRTEPVAALDIGTVESETDRLTDESDRVLVRQALGRLNDRHRSALIMREDEGLTYDQIAARTGVTIGTVESLLWRARQALKREFTVLAGPEGCLVAVPFALLLHARSGSRGLWLRLAGLVHKASEGPLAPAAMAAIATLSVATGLVATLGMGGRHGSAPSVVVQGPASLTSSTTAAQAHRPVPPAVRTRPASTTTTAATGSSPGRPVAAASTPEVSTAASSTTAVSPPSTARPIHFQNPMPLVGPKAASQASKAPVKASIGTAVVVGAWPGAVVQYAKHTLPQVGVTVPTLPGSTPSSTVP